MIHLNANIAPVPSPTCSFLCLYLKLDWTFEHPTEARPRSSRFYLSHNRKLQEMKSAPKKEKTIRVPGLNFRVE